MPENTDWQAITPFPESLSAETLSALNRSDQYRERWIEYMDRATPQEADERRDRNLRRHAIETGIIERLYDIDWGVTEELVAEGLTLDASEREGDVSNETLEIIRAQLDGLHLLVSYVKEKRPFSTSFVKELHSAITSAQKTYEAHDQFGTKVSVDLPHGHWKKTDNHVIRSDGSILQYTPAIFVTDEMEKLVSWFTSYVSVEDAIHPLALAAWLHHRFISIHPFADGNGRVARALTLLVLIQKEYAPIVVRRDNREEYIAALDAANFGDLEPLVRFFARLEEYAILAELETRSAITATSAVQVANEYAKQLKARLEFTDNERRTGVANLADSLLAHVSATLEETCTELKQPLQDIDPHADAWIKKASPPSSESRYWRAETIRAAREVDFYTNLADGTWWSTLNLRLLSAAMRFGAVIQKVGHGESGILALTFFAESFTPKSMLAEDEASQTPEILLRLRPVDSVTFLHTDELELAEIQAKEAVDKALTAAISAFFESESLR